MTRVRDYLLKYAGLFHCYTLNFLVFIPTTILFLIYVGCYFGSSYQEDRANHEICRYTTIACAKERNKRIRFTQQDTKRTNQTSSKLLLRVLRVRIPIVILSSDLFLWRNYKPPDLLSLLLLLLFPLLPPRTSPTRSSTCPPVLP